MDYRAALYIRLSKEDDHESESQSVTNQRGLLQDYARQHSFTLYDEYVDDGFSGGNFDRPAFNRLLEDIKLKKVNLVIIKDAYVRLRMILQLSQYFHFFKSGLFNVIQPRA